MQYKIIKRGKPGQPTGTDVKFYASPYYSGEVNEETIGEELSEKSGISDVDTVAVAYGLVKLVAKHLKDGKIVRLGNLGSLRISLKSEGGETAADVTSRNIVGRRILFRPAQKMERELQDLTFSKVKSVTSNPAEADSGASDAE
ncbi:MAG: hypothetical protein WBA74_12565 [Cyclobacteriaceae bacterium]